MKKEEHIDFSLMVLLEKAAESWDRAEELV